MKWGRGLLGRRQGQDEQADSMARYVLSIRMTGLGDRLICLGAAWLFARQTERILIADWRHGAYAPSAHQNVFGLCFTPVPELAGVKFIGDDRVGRLQLPRPRHPAMWNDDRLLREAYRRPAETIFAHRDAAVALIRARHDVAAPTVVFDSCVIDGLVSTADSRMFLSSLRPRNELTAAATAFRNKHLGTAPTIGLHVRHGNRAPTGHRGLLGFLPDRDSPLRASRQRRTRTGGSRRASPALY